MHEKRIAELQDEYDSLRRRRARVIAIYDRSADGSREKREAIRGLDRLGAQIRKVEEEIALLTFPM